MAVRNLSYLGCNSSLPDPSFVVDFLLTYRSFTTPKSFLDQLIERFSIYPPEFGSQAKTDEWKRTVQTPVRLRVFNVIKTWVQQYWSDFESVRCHVAPSHLYVALTRGLHRMSSCKRCSLRSLTP